MSFTIARALTMNVFQNCRLLTGNAGLQNKIRWVNILEILDDLSHIEEGEFLITTAHDFNALSESRQRSLIELFAANKLAALAIQTGHYIKTIPFSFIRLAEEHDVPIIEIPPETSFKSLTRALLNELMQSESVTGGHRKITRISDTLHTKIEDIKDLWQRLTADENPEELQSGLHAQMLSHREPFFILMISARRPGTEPTAASVEGAVERCEQVEHTLIRLFLQRQIPFLIGPAGRNMALLIQPDQLHDKDNYSTALIALRLFNELKLFHPDLIFLIGTSGIKNRFSKFKQSLEEAEQALQAAKIGLLDCTGLVSYHELGLHRLILEQKNIELLKSIFEETIAPIFQYDCRHRGSLVQTLRIYLKHGSIKTAAKELYIHRHTMKYRLEQIETLTAHKPDQPAGSLQLILGLYIYDYLKATGLLNDFQ